MKNTNNNQNPPVVMGQDLKNENKENDLSFLLTPEAVGEIREMQELDSNGYYAYIKAIDKLFFNYIGICLNDTNAIGIDNSDVFCIAQVKRLLELLEQGRQQNKSLTA